jgi:hypothetical protein
LFIFIYVYLFPHEKLQGITFSTPLYKVKVACECYEGIWEVGVQLHSFLSWPLDEGAWSASCPGRCSSQGKRCQYSLNRKLDGLVWMLWRREKTLAYAGNQMSPRLSSLQHIHYSDYAVLHYYYI